ncbi:MAG: 4Fe-4S binding protein [Nitrospira sp.]|nr:4Fe-4S binding protein [bacterium]MBL7049209.1 4Fe-4S binding protein [Nitrospira sp.]
MYIAVVNWEKCNGCGDCVKACPVRCFEMLEGKCDSPLATSCIDCGNCPDICPAGAIAIAVGWGG